METMKLLNYTDEPIPESIRSAADYAASQCGYDPFEEVLLDYEVVGIRRVSAQSVKENYPVWLRPPCSYSPEDMVRVDWQTWAVPKRFGGYYEKAVIARAESIVVAISTLISGKVFTYGLGPEYNWLEWEEGVPPPGEPTAPAFKALSALITGDWRDDVREHAEEKTGYLEGIHPFLQPAVAKASGKLSE